MKVRAYVRLMINGRYVTRTRKAFLKWPNFEIEVGEQFQVCLFTMPSSIQLEIVVGTFKEYLVDVVDVEVPGYFVKALTSASSLVKEISFSKFKFDQKRLQRRYQKDIQTSTSAAALSDAQRKKKDIAEKKIKDNEELARRNDINGVMYLKAEWKGEGPDMPPIRSENMFKQRKAEKVR